MVNGCFVMIVEDDEGVRDALAMALTDEGCSLLCARNGHEALEQLRGNGPRPCIIFLDLMMPVMDGRTFRAEQLKDERLCDIAVVVTTAGDVPDGFAGVEVLRKPFQVDRLVSMLRSCPDHHPGS